jgi:hypothetical protein
MTRKDIIEREEFIRILERENVPQEVGRKVLRYSTTLTRLAVAQCNGDWPADNGERPTKACARCEALWAPSVLLKGGLCPDCRAEDNVKALLAPFNIVPEFQGDPRGCVLKLRVPSGYNNSFGGDGLVCVPAPYL